MTYIQYVEFLVDFILTQLTEAGFLIFITIVLCGIKLELNKIIVTIVISAAIGSVLLPFGNYDILNRMVYAVLIGVVIYFINDTKGLTIDLIYVNIIIASLVMMAVEGISFFSLLYITGKAVADTQQNIISGMAIFIPVRIIEYMVCHIFYIKFGGKNEKNN
jgi:hypothetical protein